MKTTCIFKHRELGYTTSTGKIVPMILKVESERIPDGIRYKVKGKLNPLPFKEMLVKEPSVDLTMWLRKYGYEKIATFNN